MDNPLQPTLPVKSLILKLDPATREELYADIAPDFLSFIFLEAIFNTIADFDVNPDIYRHACEDPYYNRNDPDCVYQASIELLMDVLKEFDRADGIDVDGQEYADNLQEYYQAVADKLSLAMSSITTANQPHDFMIFRNLLGDPEASRNLGVTGKHWGNIVVLLFTGYPQSFF